MSTAIETKQCNTLSKGFTKRHPIGYMTSNVQSELHPAELFWIEQKWNEFTGGPEDYDFNIIYEIPETIISKTRVWIVMRSEESPMLMKPSDY